MDWSCRNPGLDRYALNRVVPLDLLEVGFQDEQCNWMQGVAFLFLTVSCRLALLEYQSVNESFKLDYTYTYTILCLPVGIKVLNAVKALFTLNKKLVKQKKNTNKSITPKASSFMFAFDPITRNFITCPNLTTFIFIILFIITLFDVFYTSLNFRNTDTF